MQKDIAIYGAGGFGREIACLLRDVNTAAKTADARWNFLGFFDDNLPAGTQIDRDDGRTLGGLGALNAWERPVAVVIAIALPRVVKSIVEKISNPRVSFPNLISPDAHLMDPPSLKIGRGNVVQWGCSISRNVELGDFNLMNVRVVVGHDVRAGNFNSLMSGAIVSGNVSMGDKNFIGMNASIYQGVKIGSNTTIGGNSLVVRPTKDGATYLGIPATQFKF